MHDVDRLNSPARLLILEWANPSQGGDAKPWAHRAYSSAGGRQATERVVGNDRCPTRPMGRVGFTVQNLLRLRRPLPNLHNNHLTVATRAKSPVRATARPRSLAGCQCEAHSFQARGHRLGEEITTHDMARVLREEDQGQAWKPVEHMPRTSLSGGPGIARRPLLDVGQYVALPSTDHHQLHA